MTVEELDHLAEHLAVSTAPWLTWAVHTRDPGLVAELLDSLTHQDLLALAVTLASQVPQPRTRPDDGVVDEVAVMRAAEGHVGPLTRAERAAAIRLMVKRGVPEKRIERGLHVSFRTIQRVLAQSEQVAS
jgi:hypothetical protein